MIRTGPPAIVRDRPLGVVGLREKFGVTVVAVKRPGGIWGHTTAQTVLYEEDQIIVQGAKSQAERFSTMP
jgi:trk system potassium uptake protein TrkA